ncbi:MAG TPA: AI-2E family transporter, partial [Candidatus Eisenbacteria bacterium]
MTERRQVSISPGSLVLFVAFLLGGLLLLALGYATREILIELLVASFLAMALQPCVRTLERRGLSRSRAVSITFVLALAAAAAIGFMLLPPLAEELVKFVRDIPNLLADLTRGQGPLGFLESRFRVVEHAREWVAQSGRADVITSQALQAAGGILHTGSFALAVAFLTFFVALSGDQWFGGFLRVAPEGSRERWHRIGKGISEGVGGYIFGNLVISVIAGCFTTAVLLATGVPYAVPLGLILAVLDL